MNYIYETGNGLGAVAIVPKELVLIDVTEDSDKAYQILKNYILSNCTQKVEVNPYNYGVVVGKIDDETLKCIPVISGFSAIGKEKIVRKLPFVKVHSDETNVEVLARETYNFTNLDIRIWWDDDGNHCTPKEKNQ